MGAKKTRPIFFGRKDGYAGLRKDIFCNFAKLRKKSLKEIFQKRLTCLCRMNFYRQQFIQIGFLNP